MKYVAYEAVSGAIRYFYDTPVEITEGPDGLELLKIPETSLGGVVDTHRVVDGRLEVKLGF